MYNNSFLSEPKVAAWQQALSDAGCTVNAIKPLALLNRPNGDLLFALLDIDAVDSSGVKIARYVFIRGHACIVVPLIRNIDTKEERFLMVYQRRVGHGRVSLEFPAGMLDRDINNPSGTALRELCEETGLAIEPDNLVSFNQSPLHSSPGATDEGIYYFGCIVEMNDTTFRTFEGKKCGCEDENEDIKVTLKERNDAERDVLSLQARLAFYLFENNRAAAEKHRLKL